MAASGLCLVVSCDRNEQQKSSATVSATRIVGPFTNSLGMRFVQLPKLKVLISIYETRVGDFTAFTKEYPDAGNEWENPIHTYDAGFNGQKKVRVSMGQTPDHPVVNVSWEDANRFCRWLTEKERNNGTLPKHARYRLPFDDEWSVAVGLATEGSVSPEENDRGVPGAVRF